MRWLDRVFLQQTRE